jgi:tRNA (adenine-N(1)-)-methyltransferase non-catalytic subunit
VSLGRYGSFFADQLIGKRYGTRFEAQNKLLTELPPLTVEDIGLSLVFINLSSHIIEHELEETDATNELINDDKVPPLSSEEIEALKSSGVHVSVRTLHRRLQ